MGLMNWLSITNKVRKNRQFQCYISSKDPQLHKRKNWDFFPRKPIKSSKRISRSYVILYISISTSSKCLPCHIIWIISFYCFCLKLCMQIIIHISIYLRIYSPYVQTHHINYTYFTYWLLPRTHIHTNIYTYTRSHSHRHWRLFIHIFIWFQMRQHIYAAAKKTTAMPMEMRSKKIFIVIFFIK